MRLIACKEQIQQLEREFECFTYLEGLNEEFIFSNYFYHFTTYSSIEDDLTIDERICLNTLNTRLLI